MKTTGYWTSVDWQRVAAAALPEIQRGEDRATAMHAAQKAVIVDRKRHKTEKQIKEALGTSQPAGKALAAVKAMKQGAREALFEAPPVEGRAEAKIRVVRTERERLLLYRRIHDLRTRLHDTRSIAKLIDYAQRVELPQDRWQSYSVMTTRASKLEADYKAMIPSLWTIKATPFVPDAKTYEEAHPVAAEPAPPPPAEKAAEAPSAPPAMVPMPKLVPSAPAGIQAALMAFADHMLSGLGGLLAAHEAHVTEAVMARVADQLASQGASMVREIADLVAHRVDRMLMGPAPVASPAPIAPAVATITPQAAPAGAAVGASGPPAGGHNPEPTPGPAQDKRLKLDVVGNMPGNWIADVERLYGGDAEIRFVHPDKMNTFAPHSNRACILLTDKIPHSLSRKFQASGSQPVLSKATAGHVMRAIESLVTQHRMAAAQ